LLCLIVLCISGFDASFLVALFAPAATWGLIDLSPLSEFSIFIIVLLNVINLISTICVAIFHYKHIGTRFEKSKYIVFVWGLLFVILMAIIVYLIIRNERDIISKSPATKRANGDTDQSNIYKSQVNDTNNYESTKQESEVAHVAQITSAVQNGGNVVAYDGTHILWNRPGKLVGYASNCVSIRTSVSTITDFDANNHVTATHQA